MSDKAVSSKSVSNKSVSSVDNRGSVGNSDRVGNSMVGNGSSVDKRGSVGNSVVGNGVGNSVGNGNSLRVGSSARVGHLSNVAVNVVGVVVDGLDTAVREVHLVGALNNTGAIVALGLAEGSARVLVSNSVVVGVGGDLGKVGGSVSNSVGNGGSVDNRSVVDNGGMVDDRGGMDHRSSVGHSMAKTMSNNTVGKSVANNAMGKTVSNDSVGKTVSGNNSVSKTVTGKELRGSRGRSKEGGDASKGLKKKKVSLSIS